MYGTEPGDLVVGKARVQMKKKKTPGFHWMFVVLESLAFFCGCPSISLSHMIAYAKVGSSHGAANRTCKHISVMELLSRKEP